MELIIGLVVVGAVVYFAFFNKKKEEVSAPVEQVAPVIAPAVEVIAEVAPAKKEPAKKPAAKKPAKAKKPKSA